MRDSPMESFALFAGIVVGVVCLATILATFIFVGLLRKISDSVGVAGPTDAMLKKENAAEKCALFRHFPSLVKSLAWRSLGAVDETPIHVCHLPNKNDNNSTREIKFYLKREDLISPEYGGNKVRTLQHQLAVCEVKREAGQKAYKHLISIGSGGSNQVVATIVHARKLGWDNAPTPNSNTVTPCWLDEDEPDLDNTLNMLSVLSFPIRSSFNWGAKSGMFKKIAALGAAWTQKDLIPMMPGGNCPVGVLGQAGAVLELAEQIEAGKSPDVERIYLPLGSGCTVSGLILGKVLVHRLGLKALLHQHFKIIGCNVHDKLAQMDRLLGLHVNKALTFIPLTITHTVVVACRALHQAGGPDVEEDALKFIRDGLEIRADKQVVGKYGGHSTMSRNAALFYDEKGIVTDYQTGAKAAELWVCGHFVSKALQPLLADLQAEEGSDSMPKYMLWMTKSAVQPRGSLDEWSKFQDMNETVKKWADQGKAESILRPACISTAGGKPDDYRSIMTQIL